MVQSSPAIFRVEALAAECESSCAKSGGLELQTPFRGWKLSGLGRELGTEGLMAFRETKHIRIRVRSCSAT